MKETVNYISELAKAINILCKSDIHEKIILDSLQNIFLYATKRKEFTLEIEYVNFIPHGKTKQFKTTNYVVEHVFGRRTASKIALKLAKQTPFSEDSLTLFLKKYCFTIKVPKEKGKYSISINALLRKYQNQSSIITYEQYIRALEECGWYLTENSKKMLKERMNVK